MPDWLKNILLGENPQKHRNVWIAFLCVLLVLVPFADYSLGRAHFHLNLYPLPVALAIFLFGHRGLFSVLLLLVSYHLVQVRLDLEAHAVLLNNLGQLALTYVVGLICSWLVEAYRALYHEKSILAETRHKILLNLSHELQNPLFAVRGIVRNLSRNFAKIPEDEAVALLNEAQSAVANINRDIQGLTQVFRYDLKGLQVQNQDVAVGELFERVLERHPSEFSPDHEISVLSNDALEQTARLDPLLVQQSIDNIVTNALRHTEGGRITLSAEFEGLDLRLVIEDDGPGIPLEERERVFQRHDQGSRERGSGFGVGLYLARLYVEAQGGTVLLDQADRGARFIIELPGRKCD